MKYKFKYVGQFTMLIWNLVMLNLISGTILIMVLFFGGYHSYLGFSLGNIGIISYSLAILIIWINSILNLLFIIRHVIESVEIEKIESKE